MATQKKLTPAQQKGEELLAERRKVLADFTQAAGAREKMLARHAQEIRELDAAHHANFVRLATIWSEPELEAMDIEVPASIKREVKKILAAKKEARRERRRPAPRVSDGDGSGPEETPSAAAVAEVPAES